MMKYSELKGRAVINLEDASKIGEVEDLLVEPGSHRIAGIKVKAGLFSPVQHVPAADIRSVGPDAVTVSVGTPPPSTPAGPPVDVADTGEGATPGLTPSGPPEAINAGPVAAQASPQAVEISSILGNKVVTDTGTLVGELRDAVFDRVDLTVTGYEVREGGLFTKAQEFVATPDVRYGDKLITIPAKLLNHPS
jgi:sporulation protein YlmC with PRC-barrel domain